MKTHAKAKRRTPRGRHAAASAAHRPHNVARAARGHAAKKHEIAEEDPAVSRLDEAERTETFTPMETGSPDRDEGSGPLGQEGEGEAQNDQLAALEGLEPEPLERDIPETWS
ncbi:MAG: hypothetical protein ACHQ2Z_16060 [Elusimicrobiota bacterium]